MLTRVLPQRVETEALTRKYGKFVLEPLERGFGTTVGNALRRVLLSALEGAAVTTLRISDIHHEFSPIPGAREDTTEFILNVKRLRFRMKEDVEEPVRCHLEVRGAGVVTAADIQCPPEVEVMNPDQYLLTVESDDVDLDIELTVEKGSGYWPAEERKGLSIGDIPVDAVFSPVTKVAYHVEPTRIGHSSDYDRLILEIWTDGSIQPDEALRKAARILVDHFALIGQMEPEVFVVEEEEVWEGIPQSVYDTPLEELDLSVRSYNCLKRAGISKVGEVLERLRTNEQDLLNIRNFGRKSLEELKNKLAEKGFLEYIQEPA